jgi:hypothetical protein
MIIIIHILLYMYIRIKVHGRRGRDHAYRMVGWVIVFNATFNNIAVISWRSVLLVEETGVPEEN